MQVRCAEPDAVEKSRDVAAGFVLHQTAAFDTEVAHDFVRLDGGFLTPGFEPFAIRAHFFYRNTCAGALARVTARAIGGENRLARLSQFFVHGKWKFGRLLFA